MLNVHPRAAEIPCGPGSRRPTHKQTIALCQLTEAKCHGKQYTHRINPNTLTGQLRVALHGPNSGFKFTRAGRAVDCIVNQYDPIKRDRFGNMPRVKVAPFRF